MIISNKELVYDARDGVKQGIIEVSVTSFESDLTGSKYNVVDYVVFQDGSKLLINQKNYIMTTEQINSADEILREMVDFSGMSKTEREWTKIKLMLLQLTQQSPIYGSVASDWSIFP